MEPELVAVRLPPGPAFLDALQQVWSGGGAVLPLPWHAPEAEVERIVHELRPDAIVQANGGTPRLRRLPGGLRAGSGTALVVATSGTSGHPKGVELTHAALNASIRDSLRRLDADRGDRWLCCLPLHHVAGIQVLLRAQRLDTAPIVHDRFDVEAVRGERRAAYVSLVPTMLHRLLAAGVDLSRYKAVLLGGARPGRGLLDRAADAGVNVVQSYGMTETCGGCVYDGVPLDSVEVRLDRSGRVAIRGSVLMRGYRNRPDLTARAFRDGWFVTSDLGRFDPEGRLEVLGRADDVIVTGGENVVASVVAEVLASHPGVQEAAVVGRPDEEWGQVVTAVVVPVDPASAPTLDELREVAGAHLPGYALPKAMWTVPSLPRDGMGKVSRQALDALVRRDA